MLNPEPVTDKPSTTPAVKKAGRADPAQVIEIFRKEVVGRRGAKLYGEISLAVPLSWSVLICALAATVVVASGFLSVASYTRVESLPGTVVPDAGVAAVMPTRPGVVTEVLVREGQRVVTGAPLFRVRVSEMLSSGVASDRQAHALAEQQTQTAAQSAALATVFAEEASSAAEQIAGLEAEITQLAQQIALQRDLVASARETVDRTREVAAGGFISRQTLQAREDTYLQRQQQLAQLEQILASKRSARGEAQRRLSRLNAQRRADVASEHIRLGDFERQTIEADAAAGYVVTAPVQGTVTAITARTGQPADGVTPIALVLPERYTLTAELAVPASAIGRIVAGQPVRLEIDGYPIQRYGSVKARVISVPAAAVSHRDAQGQAASVYLVPCQIVDPALGRSGELTLRPGMTVTGRIATRRQSLLRWLMEPIFKAFGR